MTCNCECHKTKYACNDCLACEMFIAVDKETAQELLNYFMTDAGWISFEKFEGVHQFIKRLQEFLKD